MKFGPWLIITIGAAIGSAFTHDTGRMLDAAIIMSGWLLITVPVGMWLLHRVKHSHHNNRKPKQLTDLEELWMEVDGQPMEKKTWPPKH